MRRLPFREGLERILATVLLLPLLDEVGMCGPKPVVHEFGGDGMVVGLAAVADQLELVIDRPLSGGRVGAGTMGEVLIGIAPQTMVTGVDHDHVALLDLRRGVLQILGRDDAPFALGSIDHDAGAEHAPDFVIVDGGGVLGHVQRSIHVGAAVHDAFPLQLLHAIAGMELDHVEVDAGGGGPLGHELLEGVAQAADGHAGASLAAGLETSLAGGIEDGDHADRAGFTVLELPRDSGQGGFAALDRSHVTADLLDHRDTGFEQRAGGGVPLGMILLGVATGGGVVGGSQTFHLRAAALGTHVGGQRQVDERSVHGDHLGACLYQVLGGVFGQAGGLAEVLEAVGVFLMPTGADDHDVALADGGRSSLEIVGGDLLPVLLGDVEDDTVAEEGGGIEGGQVGTLLDMSDGGVHMGPRVEDRGDAPGQHSVLGVLDATHHADVGIARVRGRPVIPQVAQFDELEP